MTEGPKKTRPKAIRRNHLISLLHSLEQVRDSSAKAIDYLLQLRQGDGELENLRGALEIGCANAERGMTVVRRKLVETEDEDEPDIYATIHMLATYLDEASTDQRRENYLSILYDGRCRGCFKKMPCYCTYDD